MKKLILTHKEFLELPEYSCSLPTGTTPGKRWRRHNGAHDPNCSEPKWMIGEYDPHDDGKGQTIRINWYQPVIKVKHSDEVIICLKERLEFIRG